MFGFFDKNQIRINKSFVCFHDLYAFVSTDAICCFSTLWNVLWRQTKNHSRDLFRFLKRERKPRSRINSLRPNQNAAARTGAKLTSESPRCFCVFDWRPPCLQAVVCWVGLVGSCRSQIWWSDVIKAARLLVAARTERSLSSAASASCWHFCLVRVLRNNATAHLPAVIQVKLMHANFSWTSWTTVPSDINLSKMTLQQLFNSFLMQHRRQQKEQTDQRTGWWQ